MTTLLFIDPGQHMATAWKRDGQPPQSRAHKDAALPDLLREIDDGGKFTVVIEKMERGKGGRIWKFALGSLQAANTAERVVKNVLGRRARTWWVAPWDWQTAITRGHPSADPKVRSLEMANLWIWEELREERVITDHNEADAVNGLRYAIEHPYLFEAKPRKKRGKAS